MVQGNHSGDPFSSAPDGPCHGRSCEGTTPPATLRPLPAEVLCPVARVVAGVFVEGPFPADLRIDLGGGNIGVPEHFLNDP